MSGRSSGLRRSQPACRPDVTVQCAKAPLSPWGGGRTPHSGPLSVCRCWPRAAGGLSRLRKEARLRVPARAASDSDRGVRPGSVVSQCRRLGRVVAATGPWLLLSGFQAPGEVAPKPSCRAGEGSPGVPRRAAAAPRGTVCRVLLGWDAVMTPWSYGAQNPCFEPFFSVAGVLSPPGPNPGLTVDSYRSRQPPALSRISVSSFSSVSRATLFRTRVLSFLN